MQNAPLSALLPDGLLMLMVVVAWLNDTIFGAKSRHTTYLISVVSAIVVGVWFAFQALDPTPHYYFTRMYVVDPFASAMKAVVTLGFAVSIIYSRKYLEDRDLFRGDFFLLGLFSLLGQCVMISGNVAPLARRYA